MRGMATMRLRMLIGMLAAGAASAQTQQRKGAAPPPAAVSAAQAQDAFERFKRLAGTWRGKSTKGWEDTSVSRVIAGGSVILSTSFDAHPGETMATLMHMDGDRLLLTHYCVAGNQPRLLLTGYADGGRTLTFSFLDGTNLPSRDRGHMDQAVYRFIDDDHYTSQWTWYQDGAEKWLEEIQGERVE